MFFLVANLLNYASVLRLERFGALIQDRYLIFLDKYPLSNEHQFYNCVARLAFCNNFAIYGRTRPLFFMNDNDYKIQMTN